MLSKPKDVFGGGLAAFGQVRRRAIKLGIVALGAAAFGLVAGAAMAEQVTVANYGVLMHGAPYAVAIDKGFFSQAGVEIDGVLTSTGGGTTVRNVFSGGLPFGEVSLAAAVSRAPP